MNGDESSAPSRIIWTYFSCRLITTHRSPEGSRYGSHMRSCHGAPARPANPIAIVGAYASRPRRKPATMAPEADHALGAYPHAAIATNASTMIGPHGASSTVSTIASTAAVTLTA